MYYVNAMSGILSPSAESHPRCSNGSHNFKETAIGELHICRQHLKHQAGSLGAVHNTSCRTMYIKLVTFESVFSKRKNLLQLSDQSSPRSRTNLFLSYQCHRNSPKKPMQRLQKCYLLWTFAEESIISVTTYQVLHIL